MNAVEVYKGYAWISQDAGTYQVIHPETVQKVKEISSISLHTGDQLILLNMNADPEYKEKSLHFSSKFVHLKDVQGKVEGDLFELFVNPQTRLVLKLSQSQGYEADQNPAPFEQVLQEAIIRGEEPQQEPPLTPRREFAIIKHFLVARTPE